LSPDGKTMTVWNREVVDRWDIPSLKKISTVQFPYSGSLRKVRLRADASLFAVNLNAGGVVFWDPASATEVGRLNDPKLDCNGGMEFSPGGKRLATVTRNEGVATIRIWNVATGKSEQSLELPENEAGEPAVSPDGRMIAFGSKSRNISLKSLRTGQSPFERNGFETAPVAMVFARLGRLVAADDTNICTWDQFSGTMLQKISQTRSIFGLLVPPDGRSVIASFRAANPRQFDLNTGAVIGTFSLPEAVTLQGGEMSLSPDGQTLFALGRTAVNAIPLQAGPRHTLIRWDMKTKELGAGWNVSESQNDMGFDQLSSQYQIAGPYLAESICGGRQMLIVANRATISEDQPKITLRDLAIDRAASTIIPALNPELIQCNRTMLAVVSRMQFDQAGGRDINSESIIECWDLFTGERIVDWKTPRLSHFALSPNSRAIAASYDNEIEFRDLSESHPPVRRQVESAVRCFAFSDDGCLLASGLDNGTILIWDVNRLLHHESYDERLTVNERAACWNEMLRDARVALRAANRLAVDPNGTLPLLRAQLKPIEPIDPKRIESLLANLNSSRFDEREAASRNLAALGEPTRAALQAARKSTSSTEVRNRLSLLLEQLTSIYSPERRRYLRAIALLERIGSMQAAALLGDLAKGEPQALETQLAKESLRRISKQTIP
jgi:WD40 repeat protein